MSTKRSPFINGVIAGLPILIGYIPAGMTFGLLSGQAAVGLIETGMFSIAVFAGASQYMAANLIGAGVGPGQIILATLLLNFRHFLMSSSLAKKITGDSAIPRFLIAFGVTDETFAVASAKEHIEKGYLLGLELISYSSWIFGTFLGFIVGGTLPPRVQAAFGVTLYCLFAALIAPMLKKGPKTILIAIAAGAINWSLTLLPNVNTGWAFIITLVLVPAVVAGIPFFKTAEDTI